VSTAMHERRCEYCGVAKALTHSPGGLLACPLHGDQPGTTPLYDSLTGAPLQREEWTAERRAAQWRAQAEGNSRRAESG